MPNVNPFKRFLFRRDLYRRIRKRLAVYRRRLTKDELSDLAGLLRDERPKVVFDVGANVGFLTAHFQQSFKEAAVYALEPDPLSFRALQAAFGATPRVHMFQVAAADKEGELNFVQRALSVNSSLMAAAAPTNESTEKIIKVKAITLDRFCAEQSIAHIDLLKVDTEGADFLVLKGAEGILGRGSVEVVMTEVLFVPTYQGQATFHEIAGLLTGHGFSLFNLYIGRETQRGQACYGNAIFIGPRLQQKLNPNH